MIRHSIAFAVKLNKCLLYLWNRSFPRLGVSQRWSWSWSALSPSLVEFIDSGLYAPPSFWHSDFTCVNV